MWHRSLWLLATLSAGVAGAQTPSGDWQAKHAAMLKACDSDIQSLCPNAQGRAVMHCLHENHAKLSPDCKSALPSGHHAGGAPPSQPPPQ